MSILTLEIPLVSAEQRALSFDEADGRYEFPRGTVEKARALNQRLWQQSRSLVCERETRVTEDTNRSYHEPR